MKKLLLFCLTLSLLGSVACDNNDASESAEQPSEQSSAQEKAPEPAAEEEAAQDEPEEEEEELAGQWVESSLYGLKFRVGDDWSVSKNEEGVSATDADGSTTVLLAGSESTNLGEQMLSDLSADVDFKEVNLEKSGLDTFNGIPGMRGSGTAVMQKEDIDQEIQFLAYSFKLDGKTATMMIFSEAEMYEAKRDIIDGIAGTVTKIR